MGQINRSAKSAPELSKSWRTSTTRPISWASGSSRLPTSNSPRSTISDSFPFWFTTGIKFPLYTNVSLDSLSDLCAPPSNRLNLNFSFSTDELSREEDVLEWLIANKSTGDEEDVIEDVTAKTLSTLIGNIDNLVVLFCSYSRFFVTYLIRISFSLAQHLPTFDIIRHFYNFLTTVIFQNPNYGMS